MAWISSLIEHHIFIVAGVGLASMCLFGLGTATDEARSRAEREAREKAERHREMDAAARRAVTEIMGHR